MEPIYPYRRSTRLFDFDYGQSAAFFISLVTQYRQALFGRIINKSVIPFQRQSRSLGSLIAQFKSVTAKKINDIGQTKGHAVWQRGYHDRIIRNEVELDNVRAYIRTNPERG